MGWETKYQDGACNIYNLMKLMLVKLISGGGSMELRIQEGRNLPYGRQNLDDTRKCDVMKD